MIFINQSQPIGQIISAGTSNITGSIVATLLVVLMVLMIIAIMFSIPLEFISVILLPFCLGVASYYGDFLAPVIVIFIYVASLIAKNWLFK